MLIIITQHFQLVSYEYQSNIIFSAPNSNMSQFTLSPISISFVCHTRSCCRAGQAIQKKNCFGIYRADSFVVNKIDWFCAFVAAPRGCGGPHGRVSIMAKYSRWTKFFFTIRDKLLKLGCPFIYIYIKGRI